MWSGDVEAIFLSDIHLSHTPPVARSAEPDWYAAMQRPLDQVYNIARDHGSPPVIIAGDIFDRWNPPPELINFAINYLPSSFAIPGQHDLPNHRYQDVGKSAFWTLVEANRISSLYPNTPKGVAGLRLHGFPWGHPPVPPNPVHGLVKEIAVCHTYIWKAGHQYPEAPKDKNVHKLKEALKDYHCAVFGDNHSGFLHGKILNCGTLMRRKQDEKHYQPCIGLLHSDGSITREPLDCSQDKFLQPKELANSKFSDLDIEDFIEELEGLQDSDINFEEAVEMTLRNREVPRQVSEIVLQAMRKK